MAAPSPTRAVPAAPAPTAEQVAAALSVQSESNVTKQVAVPAAPVPEAVAQAVDLDLAAKIAEAEVPDHEAQLNAAVELEEFIPEPGFGAAPDPEAQPAMPDHEQGYGPEPDVEIVEPTDPEPEFIGDHDMAYTCDGGGLIGGYEANDEGHVLAPASEASLLASHGFFPVPKKEK
jgi:hypothetical protein